MPTPLNCSEFCRLVVVYIVTDQVPEHKLHWYENRGQRQAHP